MPAIHLLNNLRQSVILDAELAERRGQNVDEVFARCDLAFAFLTGAVNALEGRRQKSLGRVNGRG